MLPKLSACWTLGEAGFHQLCDVSMLNSSFSLPVPWHVPLLVTKQYVTFQCSLGVRHNLSYRASVQNAAALAFLSSSIEIYKIRFEDFCVFLAPRSEPDGNEIVSDKWSLLCFISLMAF